MLVVDSSVLLSALLPDEDGADLTTLVAAHEDLIAPTLLWVELRNVVLAAERRGRLGEEVADAILAAIDDLGVVLDAEPASDVVVRCARRHGLTAYDALYLELALRRGAHLATLDEQLRRAAQAEGVPLAVG